MASYKKKYFFLFIYSLFFNYILTWGQTSQDNLNEKSLEELFDFYNNSSIKKDQINYINAFVNVAKSKNIKKRVLSGYQILSSLYNNENRLLYCDSIIGLTKNEPLKNYPSIAYNTKAIYFHSKGDLNNALENYLLSNKYAENENNIQLIFLNTYSIATIKRKIGEFDKALELYRTCLSHTSNNSTKNKHNYLLTILALSNVFYEKKEVDSAKYYNKLGVLESLKQGNIKQYHHFSANQGMIHYIEKDYSTAVDSLLKHRVYFEKIKDSMNLSYIYFHLGKIYDSKTNIKKAVKYHKKIDSIINPNYSFSKEFRESYEYIINYYQETGNLQLQLLYVNKLMNFDSIFNSKENYLSKKIFKEYDIPKLEKEKNLIKNKMQKDVAKFELIIYLITFVLLLSIFSLYHQNKKRKEYKKRFQQILNNDNNDNNSSEIEKNTIDIPQKIIDEILIKLDEFESNNKFVSNKITLNSLAKKLNTNTNYLSKVINHHKKTSFSNYLNNLKIEYIIKEIKKNPILIKFTLKALAEEAGFNNTESFSKAFFKLKGIKPSYFIKELEKIEDKI